MNHDSIPSHWHLLPPRPREEFWSIYPFDSTLVVPGPSLSTAQSIGIQQPSRISFEGMHRIDSNSDWLLIPLMLGLILVTFSRALYFRRFVQVFSSVLSSNNMNIMLREGNILGEVVSVLLFGNYMLMMGLVLYLSAAWAGVDILSGRYPEYFLYSGILIALILFIFLKVLLIQFSGVVFRTAEESGDYVLNTYLFNYIIGVLILPFVVLAIYPGLDWALHASWVLAAALYLVRVARGVLIGLRNVKFSPVLFLLYLCTLEILPLAFVIKTLINKA